MPPSAQWALTDERGMNMLGWWALSTLLTSWAVLCLMDGVRR